MISGIAATVRRLIAEDWLRPLPQGGYSDANDRPKAADIPHAPRWAIMVLHEAGAFRECQVHGWIQDRADPHARQKGKSNFGVLQSFFDMP